MVLVLPPAADARSPPRVILTQATGNKPKASSLGPSGRQRSGLRSDATTLGHQSYHHTPPRSIQQTYLSSRGRLSDLGPTGNSEATLYLGSHRPKTENAPRDFPGDAAI